MSETKHTPIVSHVAGSEREFLLEERKRLYGIHGVEPPPIAAENDPGIELAAKFVEQRRDAYVAEHGIYDPSTGITEFPDDGYEYLYELEEIIEGIRALATEKN